MRCRYLSSKNAELRSCGIRSGARPRGATLPPTQLGGNDYDRAAVSRIMEQIGASSSFGKDQHCGGWRSVFGSVLAAIVEIRIATGHVEAKFKLGGNRTLR